MLQTAVLHSWYLAKLSPTFGVGLTARCVPATVMPSQCTCICSTPFSLLPAEVLLHCAALLVQCCVLDKIFFCNLLYVVTVIIFRYILHFLTLWRIQSWVVTVAKIGVIKAKTVKLIKIEEWYIQILNAANIIKIICLYENILLYSYSCVDRST